MFRVEKKRLKDEFEISFSLKTARELIKFYESTTVDVLEEHVLIST